MKIAIIGAGSIIFCKTLILDLLNLPQLGHLDFSLMAPSTRRTSAVKAFADAVIAHNGLDAATEAALLKNLSSCGWVSTCILVTHREASAAICSRNYEIFRGNVTEA